LEAPLRVLAITQNVTVDGSIEMLGDWFEPQGQADLDNSGLLEELHGQDSQADALLVGRRTFEDLRGYWPKQTGDVTGIAEYLNRVRKYVVSATVTDPEWQNSPSCPATSWNRSGP
jgi:dihydrofolate reductase